ncbi:hypothetical protein BEH94_00710 [Candidatus Altiarchaeales archaeon WOR_SM1_SCG]|nr:hypothetical protein BEH94_00710 [Candidatus Altiarchaeales archaeon WOR_SM1_SCG]
MMHVLKLTEKLRKELKRPIGEVTNFEEISKNEIKNKIIICVGDKTCELALKNKITPEICIYDSLISRKKIKVPGIVKDLDAREIHIKNPPGHLNLELFDALSSALKSESNFKIVVDGEEDLAALAAITVAPKNSIVFYGQPGEGLVKVCVDEKIKGEVEGIMKRMEEVDFQD